MQYLGGKALHGPRIAGLLRPWIEERLFLDVFCGGLSVIRHVGQGVAIDGNPALVCMWQHAQRGWRPREITREEWYEYKRVNDPADPMTAYACFGCSYTGKAWAGFCVERPGLFEQRYQISGINKKARNCKDVEILCLDYLNIPTPVGATVYCDPPYQGTESYSTMRPWDASAFWKRAEEWATRSRVFVSEESAPDTWVPYYSWTQIRGMNGGRIRHEKIFVHRDSEMARQ